MLGGTHTHSYDSACVQPNSFDRWQYIVVMKINMKNNKIPSSVCFDSLPSQHECDMSLYRSHSTTNNSPSFETIFHCGKSLGYDANADKYSIGYSFVVRIHLMLDIISTTLKSRGHDGFYAQRTAFWAAWGSIIYFLCLSGWWCDESNKRNWLAG